MKTKAETLKLLYEVDGCVHSLAGRVYSLRDAIALFKRDPDKYEDMLDDITEYVLTSMQTTANKFLTLREAAKEHLK